MKLSSSYGVTAAVSTVSSATSAKTLESQVSTITKQIEVVNDDTQLDCKVKDSRLGTLRAQLERVEDRLREVRAREGNAADSKVVTSDAQSARASAAWQRGGVDTYA